MTDVLAPKPRRGKVVEPDFVVVPDETVPTLFDGAIDEQGLVLESAAKVWEEEITPESAEALDRQLSDEQHGGPPPDGMLAPTKATFRPPEEWFMRLDEGGIYLPARRRVQWLRHERGDEVGIETSIVEDSFDPGEMDGVTIAGGKVTVQAVIKNRAGRILSSGMATEFSEHWPDFVEKAETSAIARACAILGYGTEWATDLDEGAIADAPVKKTSLSLAIDKALSQPIQINIEPSNETGISVGGRQNQITDVQIAEIKRLLSRERLNPEQFFEVLFEEDLAPPEEPDWDRENEAKRVLMDHLSTLTHAEAGTLIQRLEDDAAGD